MITVRPPSVNSDYSSRVFPLVYGVCSVPYGICSSRVFQFSYNSESAMMHLQHNQNRGPTISVRSHAGLFPQYNTSTSTHSTTKKYTESFQEYPQLGFGLSEGIFTCSIQSSRSGYALFISMHTCNYTYCFLLSRAHNSQPLLNNLLKVLLNANFVHI